MSESILISVKTHPSFRTVSPYQPPLSKASSRQPPQPRKDSGWGGSCRERSNSWAREISVANKWPHCLSEASLRHLRAPLADLPGLRVPSSRNQSPHPLSFRGVRSPASTGNFHILLKILHQNFSHNRIHCPCKCQSNNP